MVVTAFASWHEKHDPARRVLDGALRLVEHCAETYSVLTRFWGRVASLEEWKVYMRRVMETDDEFTPDVVCAACRRSEERPAQ